MLLQTLCNCQICILILRLIFFLKIFTTHDLLQLLGVSSQSRLYRKMVSSVVYKLQYMWTLIFSIAYSYNVFSIIFQFSSIQFNFLRHTSYYFQAQGQSDSNKKGKSFKRSCNTVIYLHPQCCIYFSVQCIK